MIEKIRQWRADRKARQLEETRAQIEAEIRKNAAKQRSKALWSVWQNADFLLDIEKDLTAEEMAALAQASKLARERYMNDLHQLIDEL